jgi:hypothetical protein
MQTRRGRFEEVDERTFLFRIERHPDTEHAAIVKDGRILDILGGLERAGRSLGRLGDILVLGVRFGVKPTDRISASANWKYSASHSNARWNIVPTVMIPFGPGIFSLRYV